MVSKGVRVMPMAHPARPVPLPAESGATAFFFFSASHFGLYVLRYPANKSALAIQVKQISVAGTSNLWPRANVKNKHAGTRDGDK